MELSQDQREAVRHPVENLYIEAGAGAGKTRTICKRIEFMVKEHGISPYDIVAITYTKKAAAEMADRLKELLGKRALGVTTITIHALCWRLIRKYSDVIGWDRLNMVVFNDNQTNHVMKYVLHHLGYMKNGLFVASKQFKRNHVKHALDHYIRHGQLEFEIQKDVQLVVKTFFSFCKSCNAMTYPMVIAEAINLLNNSRVRDMEGCGSHHIILDEMQDTTPAQWKFIELYDPKTLCAVGDPRQTIFSFAGADLSNTVTKIEGFKARRLLINYRSSRNIVAAGNNIMHEFSRVLSHSSDDGVVSIKTRRKVDIPNYVNILLDQGYNYKDMAILAPTHRTLGFYKEEMEDRIPLYHPKTKATVIESEEARVFNCHVALRVNPYDIFSFETVAEYAGMKNVEIMRVVNEALSSGKPILHVWNMMRGKEIETLPTVNIQEFSPEFAQYIFTAFMRYSYNPVCLIQPQPYAMNEDEILRKYLYSYAMRDLQTDLEKDTGDRIQMLSIHQAKGLEWPVVFFVGASEGLIPNKRSFGKVLEMEEQKRVFYVATSRAKTHLFIVPEPRNKKAPSRYIYNILNPGCGDLTDKQVEELA